MSTDEDLGIAPASLVSGYNDQWTMDDVLYDVLPAGAINSNPGLSLGPVNAYAPRGQYNVFQYVATGKKITRFKPGDVVAVKLVNVIQKCFVNAPGVESLKGDVSVNAYWGSVEASASNGGWISGLNLLPTAWSYTIMQSDSSVSKTGSGTGNRCTFDLSGLKGVYTVEIQWTFPVLNRTVPETYTGDALYLNIRSVSSVRAATVNEGAQMGEDILSGVNEGNQLQAQTNGLLNTVISGISNMANSIMALPGKIAEAIKGLFVPSREDLTAIKDKYDQLLSSRLGFVYQAGNMVTGFFTDFSSALQSENEYQFVFPGIAFPMNGESIVICEEMPVDLDNDVMAVLRPVLGTIIMIISVLGFLNVARDMLSAMISGKSYYDFLHRKDDDG